MISGVVLASDGVQKRGLLDIVNTPFYGDKKLLVKEKVLDIKLMNGMPLVSASIKAMFDANSINDVVIIGLPEQCEELKKIAKSYDNGKPYQIIESREKFGDNVSLGSEKVEIPGYVFLIQADLPFVNGYSIDMAVDEFLSEKNDAKYYFPIISKEYFEPFRRGWKRNFIEFRNNGFVKDYCLLNFVIADSKNINSDFINKVYKSRSVSTPKGKINLLREFPFLAPKVLAKYYLKKFCINDLEEIASDLSGYKSKIIEVSKPEYSVFMHDIDTLKDYEVYLKNF